MGASPLQHLSSGQANQHFYGGSIVPISHKNLNKGNIFAKKLKKKQKHYVIVQQGLACPPFQAAPVAVPGAAAIADKRQAPAGCDD